MSERVLCMILASLMGLAPCGAAVAASRSQDKAVSAQAREACKAEVAAANPPGSLSRKRNTRAYLIDECVQRRAGSTR